jgi:imidazolonepropionase-like amidohydrolase
MVGQYHVRHVRLFDGERVIPRTSIVIRDGVIAIIEDGGSTPAGAEEIDGTGRTLLPGLIDSHVHTWGPLERVLEKALLFGVTSELEMQCDGDGLTPVKEICAAGRSELADIRSSGFAVTVPGGHGAEYGFPVPTLSDPEHAQEFVDKRITEGADYIKIMFGDSRGGLATMSPEILRATAAAAHERGKLTLAHIESQLTAVSALEGSCDGLAHTFADTLHGDFGAFVASRHAFVVPTLTVLESICGSASGASLIKDQRVAPYLSDFDGRMLTSDFAQLNQQLGRMPPKIPREYTVAEASVRQLRAAGVPLLVGTDAPNPGTTHGASIHRELELLVNAGLSAAEALAAATSVPARIFGLRDRGRVAPGMRADLLLVEGNPAIDITHTRNIVAIWKQGVMLSRRRRYGSDTAQWHTNRV